MLAPQAAPRTPLFAFHKPGPKSGTLCVCSKQRDHPYPCLAMEADVPTMHVTESNGEISASVEETNRVRASLGLAPLKEDAGHESAARGNVEERTKAMVKEGEEDALRDKLDSARRQRLLHQKLAGKSLGEQLAGEEMDSAAAWVQKSRGQEEDRKERRKETRAGRKVGGPKAGSSLLSQSARYDEEDEMGQEGATELGGAIVGHSIEDVRALVCPSLLMRACPCSASRVTFLLPPATTLPLC
jgi:hypothetical protein